MSNSKSNREQDNLISLTPTQQNPGSAKPEDFTINRAALSTFRLTASMAATEKKRRD